MRSARPILLAASLLALAACMDVTGGGHPLVISGTVTVAGTAQPVPNAAVEVYSTPLIVGERYLMETGTTDALGRFTVRIEKQRNYAQPNCAAMALWVRAAGYLDGGAVEIGTHDDPACESGSATVSVALTRAP
jgi:hypothetical protein